MKELTEDKDLQNEQNESGFLKSFCCRDSAKTGFAYLLVGGWNTFFAIALYTLLVTFCGDKHYLLLGVLCNIIIITNAYICYKIFVFKTKGNIIKEYLKCYSVYGLSMALGLALMYVFVDIIGIKAVFSNIIVTLMLTVVSFLGHKFFSFAKQT